MRYSKKEKINLLLLVCCRIGRRPTELIRLGKILKNCGLTSLKEEMLALVGLKRGYTSRLEAGQAIFALQQTELTPESLHAELNTFSYQPLISILLPTYRTPVIWLEKCIQSVIHQRYSNWELCIVDDASNQPELMAYLTKLTAEDTRIKTIFLEKNAGISGASNQALSIAEGELIALLDHDDELTADALFWVVKALNANPKLDYLYSDECKIDQRGKTSEFFFKPDWSPEFLLNSMYTGHFSIYRKKSVVHVGGFRPEYDFSQDYDLALRVTETTSEIYHIPRVLYLWRKIAGSAAAGGKDFARLSNLAALADAANRRGLQAEVIALPYANRLKLHLSYTEKVSIIIPSDNIQNISTAVSNLFAKTDYPDYEVILVTRSELGQEITALFSKYPALKLCPYNLPCNFSDKCNAGAKMAEGTILIFYNDDVAPIQENWLKELIESLYLPGVGGVSPKLLYPNKQIQYAGMYSGIREFNFMSTIWSLSHERDYYRHYDALMRNVSILSGACLAMRQPLFESIGGFDADHTPARHSDLDLSFKIRERGLRCVYTPYSVLWHVGNHSWRSPKQDKAVLYCLERWGTYMSYDPYISPQIHSLLKLKAHNNFQLYFKNNKNCRPNSPYILLISHELSNTGAPRALALLAQALKNEGYNIMVASASDGPMRATFEEINIPLLIDGLMLSYDGFESFQAFARDFDLIIANTILCAPIVQRLQNSVKIIWWMHEGESIQKYLLKNPHLYSVVTECKTIYTVSEYAKEFLKPYNTQINLIQLGIPDHYKKCPSLPHNQKVIFTIIGLVSFRKGHDLLIDAIQNLPEQYHKKAIFNVVGGIDNIPFFEKLNKKMKVLDSVKYYGALPHPEALQVLNETDVLICISRDEPFSIACLEAWMLGKPVILSKTVGASQFVTERQNGFIVDNFEPTALTHLLQKLIDHPEQITAMSQSARQTFINHFTFESFASRVRTIIKEMLDS